MPKKTTISITIDHELLNQVRLLNINVSGECNRFLENLINQKTQDLTGINIEVEEIKKERLRKELSIITAKLQASELTIKKWKEDKEKRHLENLKKEKEAIELSKKCINCGLPIPDVTKKHHFPKGTVCNTCFMGADKASIRKWNAKR